MTKTKKEKVILVIEDEVPLQNAIKLKLEKNGFSVLVARNTKQANNHLKDVSNIDLIWLDHYLLGKETGIDFIVRAKNDPILKNIPIFVVSNTASSDKVRHYISLGADKYYTKADYRLSQIIKDMNNFLDKL